MKSAHIALDVLAPRSENHALDTLPLGEITIAEPLAILLLRLPPPPVRKLDSTGGKPTPEIYPSRTQLRLQLHGASL